MGYYAHLMQGDWFAITQPTAVLNRLAETEGKHGHSWCHTVEEYRFGYETDLLALTQILRDYGFTADCDSLRGFITVKDFEDNKLGGSWDAFWDAFALGTTDEVCWLMWGEDMEVWGEVITSGVHRTADVTVNYTVQDFGFTE